MSEPSHLCADSKCCINKNKLLRRRHSSTLEPLVIPKVDILISSEPSSNVIVTGLVYDKQQTEEESCEIFCNFLFEEIQKQMEINKDELGDLKQGFKRKDWARNGYNVRLRTQQFSNCKLRQQVQDEAQKANLNVSRHQFMQELENFMQDEDITAHRIVILFFYCSDLLIRCRKINKNMFLQYLQWSKDFITNYVSLWIFEHGGWV